MCGIAGLVRVAAEPRNQAVLDRMTGLPRHRGPDDSGCFTDGVAWLGHRRLSIIDLAHGRQPMANEDSTVWITYNGELFNHASPRPELERAGHRYQTNCDTGAILHAHERHGAECVGDFRGMFAFASEIKALLEHPSISASLEASLLPEYLAFGYTSGERRSDEDWIRECRQRLEVTVRMRLMSDVPLGVFPSGGVDSSAIAALVKRMASGPVETFAVGYREAAFSELGYARHAAQSIGTEHREVTVSRQEFFEALPRLIWHEDEPIAWPSSVSLYFVSKLASQRVKVVLTGEGSDELFAGYSRYRFYLLNRRWAAARRLLPAGLRRKPRHTPVGQGDEPYRSFLGYWNARTAAPTVERMLYADQKKMSMATSIESRVPFLDHPFLEFAARAPQALKIRGRTAKYVLKRAVEDLLPAHIVHRKKMRFPTPLREWLRRPEAAPLLERHKNGWEDATDRIWRLLNLQLRGGIFIAGRGGRGAFESAAPTFRTP